MSDARPRFYKLPTQASPGDTGPFYAINRGMITGVYRKYEGSWDGLDSFVNSDIARDNTSPHFRKFTTWNQAVEFASSGFKIPPNEDPLRPRPVRTIVPLQVLSEAFPPNSIIMVEEEDEILPATRGDTRPITVEIKIMAGSGLFADEGGSTSAHVRQSTSPNLDAEPDLKLDPEPEPEPLDAQTVGTLHRLDNIEVRTTINILEMIAITRLIPCNNIIPQPSSPAPTLVSSSPDPNPNAAPTYHYSTSRGFPASVLLDCLRFRSLKCDPNHIYAAGRDPVQKYVDYCNISQTPSSQSDNGWGTFSDGGGYDNWPSHESDHQPPQDPVAQPPRHSDPEPSQIHCASKRSCNADSRPPQPVGGQQSQSSSGQPGTSQAHIKHHEEVQREVELRVRFLEDMNHLAPEIEEEINVLVLLRLLASVNLSREGVKRVRRAAAELD
ncbi:hypothetical protein FRC12_005052 [Ceratobasidium sp. 428]|nr:hypothetical protein FRC12_005052 [Ceratobasidium sp. 428]